MPVKRTAGSHVNTAASYLDLLEQVVGFLTDDDPGAMGEDAWTVLKNTTGGGSGDFSSDGEVYLKALGPSGLEAIHVNIQTVSSVPGNRYNWRLQGATAFDTGLAWDQQPGCIPATQGVPCLLFWPSTISYVLVADSRRFVLVAYAAGQPTQSCYCGWFDAFGSPAQYPAPLFLGGCHWDEAKNAATPLSDADHSFFARNLSTSSTAKSNAHVRMPGGLWARLRDGRTSTPFDDATAYSFVWPSGFIPDGSRIVTAYGGSYWAPKALVMLHTQEDEAVQRQGDCAIVGELRGLRWTSGYALANGDTLGTEDFFVFNDTNRTDLQHYLALELE